MKKFRFALMALAVLSFTAFYSCGGGMTEEEAQKQAEEMVSGLEDALNEAMEEPVVEEPVAEETTEEVTEEPVAEEAPAEEVAEEEAPVEE
jgi:hypothetical protein